ncbi:MAG: MFS transporter [Candidatus Methylacidiphilales bacterium]|nr:MFS transporter [Candidatus Methylacidiphilales bacterium]
MTTNPSPNHIRAKPVIADGDRVPVIQKVAYGLGGMTENLSNQFLKQMYVPVYNIGLGISPAIIGSILVVFRLWDALNDPIMGMISDNTRSRWGRRRPYIVIGAMLTGLVMPFMWLASPSWTQPVIIGYMICVGLVFYTCFTIWGMPYYSLGMEMTPDYNERTRVVAYRAIFAKFVGLFAGWLPALATLPVFANPKTGEPDMASGMRVLGFIMGGIILAFGALPGLVVKERYYTADVVKQPKVKLIKSIRTTLRCQPFQILIAIVLLQTFGSGIVGGLGFYLNIYYVHHGDLAAASVIQGLIGTAMFVPGLLSVPLWTWVSEKVGKTRALVLTILCGFIGNFLTYFCVTPVNPYLQLVPAVFMSAFGFALWMLIPSMQADVADYDELTSHQRREGSFSAVFSWMTKMSGTLTSGLSGFILVWCGFDVVRFGKSQPPEVLQSMLHWYVFLPMIFWIFALSLIPFYKLSRERMAAIRTELEAQRGVI